MDGMSTATNMGKLWIAANDHAFKIWRMNICNMPVNEDKEKETKKGKTKKAKDKRGNLLITGSFTSPN